ncbi:hypothetical protein SNEBB_001156 [Seison nebaliae]|nr:hypothetical protein SNEBB_001156 [Seison nebaliae]
MNQLTNSSTNMKHLHMMQTNHNYLTVLNPFTCIFATCSSMLIGLSGALPILFIDKFYNINIEQICSRDMSTSNVYHTLSLFSVGTVVGDVCLHQIPEILDYQRNSDIDLKYLMFILLLGIIIYWSIEKLCVAMTAETIDFRGRPIKISGYLNMVANILDNFMHGLAVTTSFMISNVAGFTALFTLIIHEIPHEIGDFAVLIDAGFTKRQAITSQAITGISAVVGSILTLLSTSFCEHLTTYLVPFTAGGFLYIGLLTVLSPLNKREKQNNICNETLIILLGISSVSFGSIFS